MATATEELPLQVKVARAAHLLSLSPRTIYRLIDAGELVAVGRGPLRRVETASILAYIERNREGGDDEEARGRGGDALLGRGPPALARSAGG